MMGLFEQFPYQNFHELNLDWLINQIKNIQSGLVLSVNGETGVVVLYQDHIVRLPDVNDQDWNIFRKADGQDNGIEFTKNAPMTRIQGANRYQVYDAGNPPPYPVTSVNGSTGAVTLYPNAITQLPSVADTSWNLYRIADGQENGLEWSKNSPMQRIQGTSRYAVYDAGNPPPYPVTSVDGATGAISTFYNTASSDLQLPVDTVSTSWSLNRNITGGNIGILLGLNGGTEEAYIIYDDGNTPSMTRLLTPADIPSSSGVVSLNGQTGVVTIDGSDLALNATDSTSIDQTITNVENDIAILVNGDTANVNTAAGQYVLVQNSSIAGISDGLYKANTACAAGASFTSSILDAVSNGGLNDINAYIDKLGNPDTQIPSTIVTPSANRTYSQVGKLVSFKIVRTVPAGGLTAGSVFLDGMPPAIINQICFVGYDNDAQNAFLEFRLTDQGDLYTDQNLSASHSIRITGVYLTT